MKNESSADRVIRLVLGLAIAALAWFMLGLSAGSPLGIAAAVVAIVLVGTAAVGFCPAYRLFGIRTCKVQNTG